MLDLLELEPRQDELAGNLSGGQKKLLELGRAMMTEAKVVLLDEVGAGVNRTLLKRPRRALSSGSTASRATPSASSSTTWT